MYVFRQIEVMHDYQGNRSCLYGPNPETDSEAEDNPEQVTRYTVLNVNCDSNVASCFRCMCVIHLGAFQRLPVRVSELTQ